MLQKSNTLIGQLTTVHICDWLTKISYLRTIGILRAHWVQIVYILKQSKNPLVHSADESDLMLNIGIGHKKWALLFVVGLFHLKYFLFGHIS